MDPSKYCKVTLRVEDDDGVGYELTAWRCRQPLVNEVKNTYDVMAGWGVVPFLNITREVEFDINFHAYPDMTKDDYRNLYEIRRLPRPEGEEDG